MKATLTSIIPKVVGAMGIVILCGPLHPCMAARVTLAWDPSTDPSVTGYRVYYGTLEEEMATVVDAGDATTITVDDLLPGASYRFAATAYDPSGNESAFSNEVVYAVPVDPLPSGDNPLADNNGQTPPAGGDDPAEGTGIDDSPGGIDDTLPDGSHDQPVFAGTPLEVIEVQLSDNWSEFTSAISYQSPVVIPATAAPGQSAGMRVEIRRLDAVHYDARLIPVREDQGVISPGWAGFVIAEAGFVTLENGAGMETGRFEVPGGGNPVEVAFGHPFAQTPAVAAAVVQTEADSTGHTLTLIRVDGDGFSATLAGSDAPCEIHYVALEPSAGYIDGQMQYEAAFVDTSGQYQTYDLHFQQVFDSAPIVLNTLEMPDQDSPPPARWDAPDAFGTRISFDDDQSPRIRPAQGYIAVAAGDYADSDLDGLTDRDEERVYGTSPITADTDGDGLDDGTELAMLNYRWDEDANANGMNNLLDPDADSDGIIDILDNCLLTPNPGQLDGDGDEYGNACDFDVNNDDVVDREDIRIVRQSRRYASGDPDWNPAADIDENGVVDRWDVILVRDHVGQNLVPL